MRGLVKHPHEDQTQVFVLFKVDSRNETANTEVEAGSFAAAFGQLVPEVVR